MNVLWVSGRSRVFKDRISQAKSIFDSSSQQVRIGQGRTFEVKLGHVKSSQDWSTSVKTGQSNWDQVK